MKDLYSLAINGEVVAENMTLEFAAIVTLSLIETGHFDNETEDITIQRVSENDE